MTTPATFGYQATRTPDGVLTIHHVPIFVECKRGASTFDGSWIATAVAKARQAEAEGYYPPLHVRHHTLGAEPSLDNVRAAGFFRVTGVEPVTFKGTRRMAVFADLVITDPMVREDVLAKRLPYRSVEIHDVKDPAIDSLALLDHEAPYLELPMLVVAEVDEANASPRPTAACATFRNPWGAKPVPDGEPLVACFRRDQSARLFFQDQPMPALTNEPKLPAPNGAKFADAPADKGDSKDKGDKGKDGEKMADAALDVTAVVKAITDGTISVADMDAIMQAIQAQRAAAKPESEATTSAPAPAAAPGDAMKKGTMDETLARIAGENAALKARLDDRDSTERRKDDVAAAMRRLEGRPVGADFEATLVAFHKDNGPKAFAAFVDQFAKTFGVLPRNAEGAAANFAGQSESGAPEAAMAFSAAGTDAVAKAARFAREWADLNSRGMTRLTEARYVEINMEKAGVKLAKKA